MLRLLEGIETNVAVKWYLTEELEDEALSVLEAGERGDVTLLAPDALFVALAESEDTVAVTADGELLNALEGTPYTTRGVHLRDPASVLPHH
jgi:predicted nucleic acid-binding protein